MYYSAIGTLAAVILLIENFDILLNLNGAFEQRVWKNYRRFLFVVLVYYATDILWGYLEKRKLATLLFADTSLYFFIMAVGVTYWTRYCVEYLGENNLFSKFFLITGRLISTCAAFLVAANLVTPVLFTVDEKCVYHPLKYRYILLISQIALLVLISVYAMVSIIGLRGKGKTDKLRRYRTLWLFGMIMSGCLTAQIWNPYLPLYAVGYLLGTSLLRTFVIGDEKEEYRQKLEQTALVADKARHRLAEERMAEERIAYARINALTGNFIVIYIVVPSTGRYREYSASSGYDSFSIPKEGLDFFAAARENGKKVIHPADIDRYLSLFTMDNVMSEIRRNGLFALNYRLMIEGKSRYVQLKAAMVDEKDGQRLIVGVNDVDSLVRHEEEYRKQLADARNEVNVDALTGVWSRHAFLEAEDRLNGRIKEHDEVRFAIVICDVNDLKTVNDTFGHKAGDQYIRDAADVIRAVFRDSRIYRVGGDEFAVIVQGEEYDNIDDLMKALRKHNLEAILDKSVVVACGMSRFKDDDNVALVFERADQNMYEDKNELKKKKNI